MRGTWGTLIVLVYGPTEVVPLLQNDWILQVAQLSGIGQILLQPVTSEALPQPGNIS
jgi:hypothetical protein